MAVHLIGGAVLCWFAYVDVLHPCVCVCGLVAHVLQAKGALTNLRNSVDTLITIPNDLLLGGEWTPRPGPAAPHTHTDCLLHTGGWLCGSLLVATRFAGSRDAAACSA